MAENIVVIISDDGPARLENVDLSVVADADLVIGISSAGGYTLKNRDAEREDVKVYRV